MVQNLGSSINSERPMTLNSRLVIDGIDAEINARLWVLNLSDGDHSLLDIAERSKLPFAQISEAAELLCTAGLLSRIVEPDK